MAIIKTRVTPTFVVPAFDAETVLKAEGSHRKAITLAVEKFVTACWTAGIPRDRAGVEQVCAKVRTDLYEASKAALAKRGVDLGTLTRTDVMDRAGEEGILARSTESALVIGAGKLFYWNLSKDRNGADVRVTYSTNLRNNESLKYPWESGFDPMRSAAANAGNVQKKAPATPAKSPGTVTARKETKETAPTKVEAAIRNAIKIARDAGYNGLAADILDATVKTLTDFTE